MLIGEVAKLTYVTPATIRYYEEMGLLTAPARSPAGYRRYSETTVEELRFIRKAQGLGFSLDEISEILMLSRAGEAPCSHVLHLAHRHLAVVEERIQQLQTFRDQLARELVKWHGQTAPSCRGLCEIISSAEVHPQYRTRESK